MFIAGEVSGMAQLVLNRSLGSTADVALQPIFYCSDLTILTATTKANWGTINKNYRKKGMCLKAFIHGMVARRIPILYMYTYILIYLYIRHS